MNEEEGIARECVVLEAKGKGEQLCHMLLLSHLVQ